MRKLVIVMGGFALCAALSGCGTTSTSHGASMGAVVGGLVGGWEGAADGALLGGGVGYLDDRAQTKRASESRKQQEQAAIQKAQITRNPSTAYRPEPDNALVGSTWRVISYVSEGEPLPDYHSMVITFQTNSKLTSLTMWGDGNTEATVESYRIMDDVLVIYGEDYVVNAKFKVDGSKMTVVSPQMRMVLEKV